MRLARVALAVLLAALGAACAGTDEPANCGHKGVRVHYTSGTDLAAACEALRDTLRYFENIGFAIDPRLSLTFAARGERESADGTPTYAHVDARSSTIVVYAKEYREPWGLAWNSKLAGSLVRHEMAHVAIWQILGPEAGRLPREWHEFIAYAVQLDLMEEALLKEVLAAVPDVRAFDALSEVNEFTYGMDPEVFAVAAYLTYRQRGAEQFVRQLLRGDIVPPSLGVSVPVLPEPNPIR